MTPPARTAVLHPQAQSCLPSIPFKKSISRHKADTHCTRGAPGHSYLGENSSRFHKKPSIPIFPEKGDRVGNVWKRNRSFYLPAPALPAVTALNQDFSGRITARHFRHNPAGNPFKPAENETEGCHNRAVELSTTDPSSGRGSAQEPSSHPPHGGGSRTPTATGLLPTAGSCGCSKPFPPVFARQRRAGARASGSSPPARHSTAHLWAGSTLRAAAPAQTKRGSPHPSAPQQRAPAGHTAPSPAGDPGRASDPARPSRSAGRAHQVQHSEQRVAVPARAVAPQLSAPPPKRRHGRGGEERRAELRGCHRAGGTAPGLDMPLLPAPG